MQVAGNVTIRMELHVPRKDAPKRPWLSPSGSKGDASQQDQTNGQLAEESPGNGHWDIDMKRNEAATERGDKGTRRAHEDSTVSAEHSKQDNYTAALHGDEEINTLAAGHKYSCMKGSISALLEKYPQNLSRPERSMLYEEGVRLQSDGQLENALKCLIGAITGLTKTTTFCELPQCLHSVGDIYCEKDEYEKAVYFIQAEKMYYETALIDITSQTISCVRDAQSENGQFRDKGEAMEVSFAQQPVEECKRDGFDDDPSSNAKKGREFENLAKFCLKEGKLQLALEYCGKATKVYKSVYGDEHHATVAARDLFTVIYADVGKKLYTDALQNYEENVKDEVNAQKSSKEVTNPSHSHPELRNRLHNEEMTHSQSELTTHEGELEPTSLEEQDDWVMTCLLMLVLFLVTIFILVSISSFYCYNSRSAYCAQTRGDINYWYMYARHMIHDIGTRFT